MPPLGPTERLLCALNLAHIGAETRAECLSLATNVADWGELMTLAELNAVVPWTLRNLDALGLADRLPSDALERARATRASIVTRNRNRAAWATRFLGELAARGVEVIVLKGFLFAWTLYGDEAYKRMNDVDILVRRRDVLTVTEVLRGLGFDNFRELYGKDEISDSSHHTPAYISADLDCVVGLHWGLVTPRAPWKPDIDGIWQRRVPTRVADTPAFGMCAEDNVLHLCVHLPFYKTGLRELADVYNCVRFAEPAFSWEKLAEHVAIAHAEDPVWRVLALTDALCPLGAPEERMTDWRARAQPATVADTDRRLADPAFLLRSRSVHVGRIEKQYVMFRKTENLAEKLRTWREMYRLLLWPEADEAARITGVRPPLSTRDRLGVPVGLWGALARDYGHLAVFAMQAHNLVSLAGAVLTAPRTYRGRTFGELPEARLLDLLE